MHESLADMLNIMTGSPLEPVVEKGIRGRAWLSHALWLSGLDPEAFAYKHVYRGRGASNLVAKWMEGRHNPTPLSIKGVEKSLPGTAWVFHLPAWPLLADRPIGARTVQGYARQFLLTRGGISLWWFPGDDERLAAKTYVSAVYPDTQRLIARNDLWGFVGTLIRTRQAEAAGDSVAHLSASKDLIRSLPGAFRLPWLRHLAPELMARVDHLRSRMLYSALLYDVDTEIIFRQTDDPGHEPCRERRKRDPNTWRFVDIEDPVLPARVIPGRAVRDKARARQWTKNR